MTTKSKATEKTNGTARKAAGVAAAAFGPAFDEGFKAFSERFGKFAGSYEEIAQFGRENFEAAVASGNLAVKAFQGINAEVLEYSKQSLDEGAAIAKALMKVRDFRDIVDLQSAYARKALDGAAREYTRLGEMATVATRESVEPINRRVNETLDQIAKANIA